MRSTRLAPVLYLITLVAVWAANWPLLKLALADIGPYSFTSLRLLGSSLIIFAALWLRRRPMLPPRPSRLRLALCGVLQMGGMLGLSLVGLQFVGPGRAAVLVYTMQLWTIPLGYWIAGERPGRGKLAGSLISFLGLLLFFNPALVDWGNRDVVYGNALLLLSAISWALGAVLYRHWRFTSDAWAQTAWQLLMGSLPLIAAALATESSHAIHWTRTLDFVLVFNWLAGTAFAYFFWMRILREFPASTAGQAVMMVPVLAYLLSAVFLHEEVTAGIVASILLIIAGLTLTLRQGGNRAPSA